MRINNLKKIRKKKGLTQVEITEKANITERSYQRYEAGERLPNIHTAQLIAEVLGLTIEKLFPLPTTIERGKKSNTDSTNTKYHIKMIPQKTKDCKIKRKENE